MGFVSWDDVKDLRPVDPEVLAREVSALEARLRARQLRERLLAEGIMQAERAERIAVPQQRVAAIEPGRIRGAEYVTARSYVEALGGRLPFVAEFDDRVVHIA